MGIFDIFTGGKTNPKKVIAHLLDPKAGYTTQEWIVGRDVDVETVSRFAQDGNLYIAIAYKSGEPVLTVCNKAMWKSAQMELDAIDLQMNDSPSLRMLREFEKNQDR